MRGPLKISLIFVTFLFAAPPSHAFTVDGLYSGMHEHKFRAAFNSKEWIVQEYEKNGLSAYQRGYSKYPDYGAYFVNGKLRLLSKEITPSMLNYVNTVSKLTADYGSPINTVIQKFPHARRFDLIWIDGKDCIEEEVTTFPLTDTFYIDQIYEELPTCYRDDACCAYRNLVR